MKLHGWPYIGRNINDELHTCIFEVVKCLQNARDKNLKWAEVQNIAGKRLKLKSGSIRTIKRVMEKLGIVKNGAVSYCDRLPLDAILTQRGKEIINIYELLYDKSNVIIPEDNKIFMDTLRETLLEYCRWSLKYLMISKDEIELHPLRETLFAINKFESLDYFEWIIVNSCCKRDGDCKNSKLLEQLIDDYRNKKLNIKKEDIEEYALSDSYYLTDFTNAGFIREREDGRFVINHDMNNYIDAIINSEV